MDRSHLRPLAPLLMGASCLLLALTAQLGGCRPPRPGPTPWNVVVVSLDGLTQEHLESAACQEVALVSEATHYKNAYAYRPDRRTALETFWIGDTAGLERDIVSLPKLAHSCGIVTGAMLAAPPEQFDEDLLVEFTRVESMPVEVPLTESLGGALASWVGHAQNIHMGSWLLWLHGQVDESGPAALFARLQAEIEGAGFADDTLVVLVGMPQLGLDGQVPLAFFTPNAGFELVTETVGLHDMAPTISERLSQRLLDPEVAVHAGNGVSVSAGMLGLEFDRAPVRVVGLDPDGATIEVRDEEFIYRWSPGDAVGHLSGVEDGEDRETHLARLHSVALGESSPESAPAE